MPNLEIFREILLRTQKLELSSFRLFLTLIQEIHSKRRKRLTVNNFTELAGKSGLALNTVKKAIEGLVASNLAAWEKDEDTHKIKIHLLFERPFKSEKENNIKGTKGYIKLRGDLLDLELSNLAIKVFCYNNYRTQSVTKNRSVLIFNDTVMKKLGLAKSSVSKANAELVDKGLQTITINKAKRNFYTIEKPLSKSKKTNLEVLKNDEILIPTEPAIAPSKVAEVQSNYGTEISNDGTQISNYGTISTLSSKEATVNYLSSKKNAVKKQANLEREVKKILSENGYLENQDGLLSICIKELENKGIVTKDGRFVKCGSPLHYLAAKTQEHGAAIVRVLERYSANTILETRAYLKTLSIDQIEKEYLTRLGGNQEDFNLVLKSCTRFTSDEYTIVNRLVANLTDKNKELINDLKFKKLANYSDQPMQEAKKLEFVDEASSSTYFKNLMGILGGVV
jgi:DNA-binding transcriptional regulator GbsR (MarR family)